MGLQRQMLALDEEQIQKGVSDAFCFWLSSHDITTPNLIEDAIKKAFDKWLDDHTDEIIDRIAFKSISR